MKNFLSNDEPYVSSDKNIAEFTIQAVLLGVILSVIMCAANIYVGLYAGMTVSAAIPASVISMGVLRGILRRGTILENNIVHTIASSGESLAAGIIFTVPAIMLLGIWQNFNYFETTLIAMAGGVMGVVMMIPLRKTMIVEQKELTFPEGVACAQVLKAGDKGGAQMFSVFYALIIGGLFKALVSIVGIFKGTVEFAFRIGTAGFYIGSDISPMLAAVGFIVGWEISLLVFLGGCISFVLFIPILSVYFGSDVNTTVLEMVLNIWDTKIRFLGIGAMIVGGLFSIFKIAPNISKALSIVFYSIKTSKSNLLKVPRTQQDISGNLLLALIIISFCLAFCVYYLMSKNLGVTIFTSFLMFVLAFFFVTVASYIVGLVGSSNSPVSGMTICTVLITAIVFLVLGYTGAEGMLATLGVAGVVCCAACTSGDICQDLKIGHIVGATPKKLQLGELIGVTVAALMISPLLQLLQSAYGIGRAVHEGIKPLKAPQAVMFEKLVSGIFGVGVDIPWDLVGIGMIVAIAAIVFDKLYFAKNQCKFRLYPMPLAVGMYLPLTVTFPMIIGGSLYKIIETKMLKDKVSDSKKSAMFYNGMLYASGLVAGEAIMGIVIAILYIIKIQLPLLSLIDNYSILLDILSIFALIAIMYFLYKKVLSNV